MSQFLARPLLQGLTSRTSLLSREHTQQKEGHLANAVLVIPTSFLGWTGTAIAHRFVRHRQDKLIDGISVIALCSRQCGHSDIRSQSSCTFDRLVSGSKIWQRALAKTAELRQIHNIQEPNSRMFVLSCAVFVFCYLFLVSHERHWQHANILRFCLLCAAIMICACFEATSDVLVEAVYRYLPTAALCAEVLSLSIGAGQKVRRTQEMIDGEKY